MEDQVKIARANQVKVPDYFDWVLGWRNFAILADGTCVSPIVGVPWGPGENKAYCIMAGHRGEGAPHGNGHHCGFNAFFEPRGNYGGDNTLIRGRGERFAIHPDGFRAEYAEIIAFIGGRDPSVEMKAAAKRYNVPIFKRRWTAEQYAKKKELGDWFPKERRPKRETIVPIVPMQEADWNEIPIGDMNGLLSYGYLIFIVVLWTCLIAGFLYGVVTALST